MAYFIGGFMSPKEKLSPKFLLYSSNMSFIFLRKTEMITKLSPSDIFLWIIIIPER